MRRPYCTKPGQVPTAPIDWRAKKAAVDALPFTLDEETGEVTDSPERAQARADLEAERLATTSHFARNGNPAFVLVGAIAPPGFPDIRPGRHKPPLEEWDFAEDGTATWWGLPLRCPECEAPVRVGET